MDYVRYTRLLLSKVIIKVIIETFEYSEDLYVF